MTIQNQLAESDLRLLTTHAALPGESFAWLNDLRESGAERFRSRGLPNSRVEAWKYTNLKPLTKVDFAPGREGEVALDKASLPALEFGREAKIRLVFVNGHYRDDLSTHVALPKGASLMPLGEALEKKADLLQERLGGLIALDQHPLVALNTALMSDGVVLHVEDGVTLDHPVEILWVGAGGKQPPVYHTRNLVVAEANSRMTLVEHHVGLCIGAYFSNQATEVYAERGAIVRHCKVQAETDQAYHVALTQARLDRDARYDNFAFSIGSQISRNEIHVLLDAPGGYCRLNGAFMMKAEQHCDNTLLVDHAKPETTSRQLYKGVLDDRSRGVFQGKVLVRKDAQRADGQQMNRALLLSERAEIDSKPELEIFADDVKCAHGATTGDLDAHALFYLRSRGIPEKLARRILIEAFLGEVIDGIALAGMRSSLEHTVSRWMGSI